MTDMPKPTEFSSAPLRNRLRVALDAPLPKVWTLVGDPGRLPEYSAGLARVDVSRGASGRPESFVCHFKPMQEGAEGVVSHDRLRWWAAERGWASSGAQADAFGLENDLNVVVLEPTESGAILSWEVYFDSQDVGSMKAHFDEALSDIGENLVRRFGGRILERYVQN